MRNRLKTISTICVGALFTLAGVNHFIQPEFYTKIMPPYLPAHLTLVYVSGFFEILGGVGVLIPRIRRLAGWGLIALLLAVFPANLHMAVNPEEFPSMPSGVLLVRLPLQFFLTGWVWWACCSSDEK